MTTRQIIVMIPKRKAMRATSNIIMLRCCGC